MFSLLLHSLWCSVTARGGGSDTAATNSPGSQYLGQSPGGGGRNHTPGILPRTVWGDQLKYDRLPDHLCV